MRSMCIGAYAFFDGPRVFWELARGMAANPELKTTLMLNIQWRRGDATAADQLVWSFTEHFSSKEWPGPTRPAVFYDPRALDL